MRSVLFCLFLFPFLCMAQSKLQQVSSAGVVIGNRAAATADGGYITVTKNEAKVPFTITAFKYSATGALQWKTTVTNGVSNWTTDYPQITQTTSGDYIISILEELGMDFIKLDKTGTYVWDKTYRKGKVPSIITIADAKSNGKGSMFICGLYSTFSKLQGYVGRLDEASGSLLWFKNVYSVVNGQGAGNDQDRFYALAIAADGGFIAAGLTTQVKNNVNFTQYFSLYKYNTDGTREWAKAVSVVAPSSFGSTLVTDFSATNSKNFILTGYNNFGQNCYLSVNDTGAVTFAKRVTNMGDVYYPLAQATYSPQTKRVYLLSSSNNGQQANRVALTANGDVQAAGNLAFDSGRYKTNDDFIALKNGSLVATGYDNDANSNDNSNRLYIAQYPAGALACSEAVVPGIASVAASFTMYTLSVTEIAQVVSTFVEDSSNYSAINESFAGNTLCSSASFDVMENAAPVASSLRLQEGNFAKLLVNPAGSSILLQVSAPSAMPLQITVTSPGGQLLKTLKLQANAGVTNVSLPAADLQKGIYILQVAGANMRQSLKVVKM